MKHMSCSLWLYFFYQTKLSFPYCLVTGDQQEYSRVHTGPNAIMLLFPPITSCLPLSQNKRHQISVFLVFDGRNDSFSTRGLQGFSFDPLILLVRDDLSYLEKCNDEICRIWMFIWMAYFIVWLLEIHPSQLNSTKLKSSKTRRGRPRW